MPIPHPSRCRLNLGEYFDTVIVYAPASDYDDEGAPLGTPGAAGSPLACWVRTPKTGDVTREHEGPTPTGVTSIEITFAADPGVSAVGQQIAWTDTGAGALSPPILLEADGPARPPDGLGDRWSVTAARIA